MQNTKYGVKDMISLDYKVKTTQKNDIKIHHKYKEIQ